MPASANFVDKSRSRWKWLIYLAIAIALVVAARLFHFQDQLQQALDWVDEFGSWGPILFIGIYMAASVLFVPGSVLTLGAGAVFGVTWGFIYASIASTLGATGAFLVSRYLLRDAVRRRFEGDHRFAAIDEAVASEGWKIVGLIRLSPVFPFTLSNYAFGLTRIGLGHYMLASWIGMMPGTVMYVYFGSLAQAAGGEHTLTAVEWTLYGIGLLAAMVVTIYIAHLARQALARRIS